MYACILATPLVVWRCTGSSAGRIVIDGPGFLACPLEMVPLLASRAGGAKGHGSDKTRRIAIPSRSMERLAIF